MELGIEEAMGRSLARGQVVNGAVDLGDRQLPFLEKLPELLDNLLLDVRKKVAQVTVRRGR